MNKLIFIFTITIVMLSCKKVSLICEDAEYTYDTDVKMIIEQRCNNAGCHDAGSINGEFTSYEKLEIFLKNGKFNKHVFVDKDMPKNDTLSFDQKVVLQCWFENGYEEN